MNQDGVTILAGTTKGAFMISSRSDRKGWTVKGPFCDGWPINHIIGDPTTRLLWAGGGGEWHGAGVWRSKDLGATWESSQKDRSMSGGQRSAARRNGELD